MQRRKNRYQRDRNGHIIEAGNKKNDDKLKGKAKEDVVTTKNTFDILDVQDSDNTTLRITESKGEENIKNKRQEQGSGIRVAGKEKEFNFRISSPNATGNRVVGNEGNPNPAGEGIQEELKRVKKEAVEKVLENQNNGNPTPNGIQSSAPKGQLALSKKKGNGLVTPSKTGEILAFVDGVPVYALEKGLDEGVHMKVREDTMGSDQQTCHGKEGDPNGTVISGEDTTVTLRLGSVYEMQFKMMQAVVCSIEQNKGNERAKEQFEQAIVPRSYGEVEAVPMACESGTDQIMQLHLNVPLKTPFQHLHDLVTHNVAPIEEDILR
ncbi:hypothetical protein A4A49_28030 [Nicotiana attenuata]|uniref:Uncharacterized protein n=1 Tax=Nicotiana attenuata TaxID=49451 RepID=A0A1J6KMD7_NICAT|nr:hypothetical protein A4A49_28030 [Nicotiana attenuata]